MRIYTETGEKIIAIKNYKRPRFTSDFGRTWQWYKCIIDSKETDCVYDNTWGSYWHFLYKGDWYKVHLWKQYELHYGMKFTTEAE